MAKTTFWYAVMALTVVASAVAVPLATVDAPASENETVNTAAPSKIEKPAEPSDLLPTAGSVEQQQKQQQQQQPQKQQLVEDFSEAELVPVRPESVPADPELVPANPDVFDVMPNVEIVPDGPVASEPPSTTVPGTDSPSAAGTSRPGPATTGGKKPKPYHPTGVQPMNFGGPGFPFFLEFFQPFQPYGQSGSSVNQKQPPSPFGHKQQPFGISVDPFDPFATGPAQQSPFHQLVEAYTNEFRNMLETIEKMPTMTQMTNVGNTKDGSGKPVAKTTSKTEIIGGHVVQVNETTYSDGDDNHKTFYHFKEIQVLPEKTTKNVATEKLETTTKDDSESQREETNEIRRDPIDAATPSLRRGAEESKEMRKVEQ